MVSAQELVLLTRGNGRRGLCGRTLNLYFAAEESADFRKTRGLQHVRQFSSSELSPQLLTPSHLFDTCRHTRSFWQRKALVGGHWNLPARKNPTWKSATMKHNRGARDSSVTTRTALFGVLIGVVATVVLAVALPGQRFA